MLPRLGNVGRWTDQRLGGPAHHCHNGCFQTENQWILKSGLTRVNMSKISTQVYEISTEGLPIFLVFYLQETSERNKSHHIWTVTADHIWRFKNEKIIHIAMVIQATNGIGNSSKADVRQTKKYFNFILRRYFYENFWIIPQK